jgi:anti-sigma B factor antagonist
MPEFDKARLDGNAAVTLERDPAGVRVRVVGELDISTAPGLERVLDELTIAQDERLLLDLDGVEFLDSTGLAALIRAQTSADLNGHRLTVRASSTQVQRLFELTGMFDRLTVESVEGQVTDHA